MGVIQADGKTNCGRFNGYSYGSCCMEYENISECLSTKREIERNIGKHLKSTRYACEMRKVKLDKNADGKYFVVNIVE